MVHQPVLGATGSGVTGRARPAEQPRTGNGSNRGHGPGSSLTHPPAGAPPNRSSLQIPGPRIPMQYLRLPPGPRHQTRKDMHKRKQESQQEILPHTVGVK